MHVEQWRDRHGKVRTYFRRGKGERVPLPSIGTEGFEQAYAEACMGRKAAVERRVSQRDTIAGLIASYMRSPAYVELRETTRKGYLSRLEAIRMAHGHRSVSGLTLGRIEGMLSAYAGRPGARLDTLKKLRILIRHGIRIGWLQHDPSKTIKRPKIGKIRSWTEAEISAYEARWPIGSKQRLAFALFLYTGQRVSDVHRMTWADIAANRIQVRQQKTGKQLSISLHTELLAVLSVAPREHVTILNTVYGRPFTVKGFGQWMRDAITEAGLPLKCQPHGLRKAAGRRLAEAGCTAKEIMSILGHETLAEAERYTEEANQEGLATAAVVKLERQTPNKVPKPRKKGLGKSSKAV